MSRQKLKLLLVEDSHSLQQLAKILIEKQGDEITVVDNGLEALQCLSQKVYDLVLLDLHMPIMDGLTTLRFIRDFERGTAIRVPELNGLFTLLKERLYGVHTYIVAVTASGSDRDRKSCMDAGMDAYLAKPYKVNSFENVMTNYLRSRR